MGGDPVAFGLVASLNRPGSNVTGVTLISGEIVSKRIALLRDLLPGAKTLAVLMNATTPASAAEVTVAEGAAHTLGWQVKVLNVGGERDFDAAFEPLAREPADALLVTTDPIFESQRDQIVGAKPGDMPIQVITRHSVIFNLRTARAIGVAIPPELLKQADQVIE